jgi:hypothetical protein
MSTNGPGVFPLPPFPSPLRSRSHSSRLLLRYHRSQAVIDLANQSVSSINTLASSFSRHTSSFVNNQFHQQRNRTRLLSHIYSASQRFVSRQDPSLRDDYGSQHHPHWDFGYINPYHAAVPLVADKVSLPSQAGTARLLDLLPPALANLYSNPASLLRPTPLRSRVRPAAFCASRSDYISLIRRLLHLGMVCLKHDVLVVNGVFAVEKDADTLRLIIDARPANAVFNDPPTAKLPTPDLFAQLQAPSDEPLWVAKVDLDNFYHRFLLPEWMQPFFGLPPVSTTEVGLPGDGFLYPCCTTLPMGWSHSVFVAQAAHEHILNSHTRLSPSDRIASASDLLLDRPRHAVYIDDLILFGTNREEIADLQSHYVDVVSSLGLPAKPSKVVLPSCDGVECLGLEVHGRLHTVGLSVPKLQLVLRDTRLLLNLGSCTGLDLARLVGRWSGQFSHVVLSSPSSMPSTASSSPLAAVSLLCGPQ